MKVKVIESLTYGVPVVASVHALEGFPPAIAGACSIWDGVSTTLPDDADPRDKSEVETALNEFREDTFFARVSDLWAKLSASGSKP